jgi:hypothetical protein
MTLMPNTATRAAIIAAAALLVLTLAGCPGGGYYDGGGGGGGGGGDGTGCTDWSLAIEVTNSTGYTWDGIGIGVDWTGFTVRNLSNSVPDGETYVSSECWYWTDYSEGTQIPVYVRARDTDGNCYSPSGWQFTVSSDVTVPFNITMDDYEGGGCP